jgi:Dyp-type peroxidase family
MSAAGVLTGAIVHTEIGRALFNSAKEGIEHFGYVDGRSQPLMLLEDIEKELNVMDGIDNWSPAFGPAQVVAHDPGGSAETSFGSYFVFRKLEENVAAFKAAEEKLGEVLGLGEAAGALVVGRYEDGTPIAISPVAVDTHPVPNNFNYDQQPPNSLSSDRGPRCPFQGHIRKTNPRTDDTRLATMARRGITYGDRSGTAVDGQGRTVLVNTEDDFPTANVGLLFASFQQSLGDQFETIQGLWANNAGFPLTQSTPTGIDPVIGQGPSVAQLWPKDRWGAPLTESIDFYKVAPAAANKGPFVHMQGGEYFFAPSLSFLKSL